MRLRRIRMMNCCICGDNTSAEAAHVRMPRLEFGKEYTGRSEKPDDRWTVPLCGRHHREQHTMNEQRFWTMYGIDPVKLAMKLT